MNETIYFNCEFLDDIKGSANLKFSISIPQGIVATFYWADENGKELSDYLPIKSIPLVDGTGEYVTNKNLMIPEEARKIYCKVLKDTMKELFVPELIIDIPEEKLWKPEGKLLKKFVAASDIHCGGDYFNNDYNRKMALSRIRDIKPDGVIISGDIANDAQTCEYDEAYELIEEYLKDIPVYVSAGNHDYHPYKPGSVANHPQMAEFFGLVSKRNESLGEKCAAPTDRNTYDGTMKDFCVLVLNPCREDDRLFYGKEQLEWIDDMLCKTDGDRFRFLVTHVPQDYTVGRSFERMGHAWLTADHDDFRDIMNRHGKVIHISGHTHYDFDSDGINTKYDTDFNNLYIGAGCLVWCGVEFDKRREYYIQDRCTAQLIEVYEDCLVIRGMELVSGKYVARCLHRAFM